MANVGDVFGGNLKASDFNGKDVRVTIKSAEPVKFDDGPKLQLYFAETDRGFVCNKTNANTIADLYGPDYTTWVGRSITLYPTETEFQGKMTPCIRVRTQVPEGPVQPAAPPAPSSTDHIPDSDIPF